MLHPPSIPSALLNTTPARLPYLIIVIYVRALLTAPARVPSYPFTQVHAAWTCSPGPRPHRSIETSSAWALSHSPEPKIALAPTPFSLPVIVGLSALLATSDSHSQSNSGLHQSLVAGGGKHIVGTRAAETAWRSLSVALEISKNQIGWAFSRASQVWHS